MYACSSRSESLVSVRASLKRPVRRRRQPRWRKGSTSVILKRSRPDVAVLTKWRSVWLYSLCHLCAQQWVKQSELLLKRAGDRRGSEGSRVPTKIRAKFLTKNIVTSDGEEPWRAMRCTTMRWFVCGVNFGRPCITNIHQVHAK